MAGDAVIGWQAKAIGAALILAALGGLLWHDHHQTHRANQLAAEKATLTATLTAERANRSTEQADRRKADEAAKSLEAELASIRNAPAPVSVFCRPARVPSAAGQGGATASADAGAGGQGAEGPLRDVGSALADVWREHESNAARQRALIEWERARAH